MKITNLSTKITRWCMRRVFAKNSYRLRKWCEMTSGGRGSEAVGSGQSYRGPHQAAAARGPAVQGNVTVFVYFFSVPAPCNTAITHPSCLPLIGCRRFDKWGVFALMLVWYQISSYSRTRNFANFYILYIKSCMQSWRRLSHFRPISRWWCLFKWNVPRQWNQLLLRMP